MSARQTTRDYTPLQDTLGTTTFGAKSKPCATNLAPSIHLASSHHNHDLCTEFRYALGNFIYGKCFRPYKSNVDHDRFVAGLICYAYINALTPGHQAERLIHLRISTSAFAASLTLPGTKL